MGDSLSAAGVVGFWTPLTAFILARIGALLIGAIPGAPGGSPSITTQLILGAVFAKWRHDFHQKLGKPARGCPGVCKDVLCYASCCCIATAIDAETIDNATGVHMKWCSLVGEPVCTGTGKV